VPENEYIYRRGVVYRVGKKNECQESHRRLEKQIGIPEVKKYGKLDKKLRYPKITNYVITFKLKVVIDLYRISAKYPNTERGCNFAALIIRMGATFLVFTSGVVVGPGCKTYYSAKYLSHCVRIMIESVPQPVVVRDEKNGNRTLQLRTLQGLTSFVDFKVRNIVANGSLNDQSIDLAKQEQDNEELIWNPRYFPGLKVLVTEKQVPELRDVVVTVQEFDKTANGVCMGGRKVKHVHLSFQYVSECVKDYVDFNVPKESSERYAYRYQRKKELAQQKKENKSDDDQEGDNLYKLYSNIYKRLKTQVADMDEEEKKGSNYVVKQKSITSNAGKNEELYSSKMKKRSSGESEDSESNEWMVSAVLKDLDDFLDI